MTQEEVFDSFYRGTRSDVLLEAFLLTGDLTASTRAVRDAYVIAWHHWRKVRLREDPIGFVRPLAWRLAQRRHTGRIWHRNKGLTAKQKAVLGAIHKIPASRRRVLLLVDLVGLELPEAARELAVTTEAARLRMRQAREKVAGLLDVPEEEIGEHLRSLAPVARTAKLPRPSIVLRAGRQRRRLHTLGAVTTAIALTVGLGAVAREPGRDRAVAVRQLVPGSAPAGVQLPDGVELTPEQLLADGQLRGLARRQSWTVTRTDNNTRGDGINTICQQSRFADPRGITALVQQYASTRGPAEEALQTVEVSADQSSAERAYRTTVGWFAGCQEPRVQLISAYRIDGVGDQADLLQLQAWQRPASAYSVAVSRVGEVTTMLVVRSAGQRPVTTERASRILAKAVAKLCPGDAATCADRSPDVTATPPPRTGEEPGFLAVVDLPPVGRISAPWAGIEPVNALRRNVAMTTCDLARFRREGAAKAQSRTFLIPEADLPPRFGLTETVGRFPSAKAAARFLQNVRGRVARCEDRDPTVTLQAEYGERRIKAGTELWTRSFESDVTEQVSVRFRIGFVRRGKSVAELTFVPSDRADLSDDQFLQLVRRAGERLGELQ